MIYPEIGELVRGILKRRKHIYLCTNGMFIAEAAARVSPDQPLLLQRPSRRPGRDARPAPSSARASSRRPSRASTPPRRPASSSAPTRPSTRKPTSTRSIALFAYLTKLAWMASCCRRPTATRRCKQTNPKGAAEIFLTRDDIRDQVPGGGEAAAQVPHDVVADLPGVPQRQTRADLHRLGQSDAQRQGLEGPVLSHHRRASRHASTT